MKLSDLKIFYFHATGKPVEEIDVAGRRYYSEEFVQHLADRLEQEVGLAEAGGDVLCGLRDERIAELRTEIGKLRHALIEHRADLHCRSDRPCPTCRESAEALGIAGKVPYSCSRREWDAVALAGAAVKTTSPQSP